MEVVTRLGIADASTLLREGLMRVLGDKKDVSVVGQASERR
jgi:DNA-binding NarL/FixJ family response regulator